jgi:Rrf2 family protein
MISERGRMFSKTTRYALWVLVSHAESSPRGYLWSRGLAQRLRIPGPYLVKVLYTLSKHDVLESVRGRTGGYRLKFLAAMEETTIADLSFGEL